MRSHADEYEDVIEYLEDGRQRAYEYSNGLNIYEPDHWEYWKEREGLSEPKSDAPVEANRADVGSEVADSTKKTNRTTKTYRGVTLPDGSDVTSIVRDAVKMRERILQQYGDAPQEIRNIIEPIADMSEPIDMEDVVYERLASLRSPNTRHKLILNGVGAVKGVAEELGLPAKELQSMIGMNAFALPENGGISLQKMAESIAEDINAGVYAGISNADVGEVRDMLIEAIRSSSEPADISYHCARRRIALAQSVYDDYVREVRVEEERYAAEEDAYNAYIENELMELEKVVEMLPAGGITAIFADEYIREQELREEYERTIERSDRGSEILQGARADTSRGVESSPERRTVSEKIGGRMLEGADAAAQGGSSSGVAEREAWDATREEVGGDARADEVVKDSSSEKAYKANNTGTSLFQYFTGALSELISLAKHSAQGLIKKVIAPVSSRLKEDLSARGVVIDEEYKHVIDNNAIRHTLKKHSGKNEEKRGQVPIVDADFDRIADVVENYDGVEVLPSKTTAQRIIYHKAYPDGTVMYVEEQRVGRKELAAVTMWKKKIPTLTDANRTETTQISDLNEVSRDKDTRKTRKVNELGEKSAGASVQKRIEAAEAEVNTSPTEGQKEAGNYKKGHVQVGTFNITIEQPKGSVRSGVDKDGKKWETTMQNTYGYIRGTEGVDGDHIDVFLSDDIDGWNGRQAYVVDQYNEDGTFDEHKVMLGFNDINDAEAAYLSNYERGWADKHKIVISSANIEDFEKWLESSRRKTKAFAEYKTVKRGEGQSNGSNRSDETTKRAEVTAEGVRERVSEWEGRIGAKVRVIERAEDVDNVDARQAIERGLNVSGWYDVKTDKVEIYAPNVRDVGEVDRTIVHEVVSHKGLRGMLGEKAFNKLCDKTWDMMSEAERAEYESYPGVENIEDDVKRRRSAADEYISHLAEGVDLSDAERSTWRKVMDSIMDFLKKLYSDIKLTEKDLEEIIKASYRRMRVERERGLRANEANKPDRANKDDSSRFRFIGERGAGALDRAEEASVRLDNLTVAREIERKFGEKKSRIEKLRSSKPIEIDFNNEYELNRDSAKQWLKDNIRGEYVNKDTGETISISKVGINEVTSHGTQDKAHLISLKAIPDFIEESIFIDEIENTKDNNKYDSYRYYVCGAKIGGEDYTVKIVVGVKGDNKYYDHRLIEIEKGSLIDNLNGLSNSVAENQRTSSDVKDSKLVSILQVNDNENAKRIKLATGWERGADGKWRYEVSDGKFDVRGELHPERRRLSKEEQSELDNAFDDLLNTFKKGSLAYDKEITEDTDMADIYVAGGMSRERADVGSKARVADDALYRRDESVEIANERFNEELQRQIAGTLPKGHIYRLGMPSEVLLSTGLPNLPIELAASRLSDKSMQENHPFDLSEIKGLVKGVQNPLAVLRSATHLGSYVVLTEMQHGGKNFVVAIEANRKERRIEVNSVRSVHYRNSNTHIANWIKEGLLEYADKERMPEWLSKQQYNSADVRNLFRHSAKIVERFENPTIDAELSREGAGAYSDSAVTMASDPRSKAIGRPLYGEGKRMREYAARQRRMMAEHVGELAEKLHLDNVEIVTDAISLEGKKARAKGFYSRSSGKITVVIPNHGSVSDAVQTLLHEAVAHHGLRQLFGEHFDTFLDNVYNNADAVIHERIDGMASKNGGDFRKATEEYLAGLAEKTNFEEARTSGWWSKIKEFFMNLLHKIGFKGFKGITLTDNELRYILWRSYMNLKEPGKFRSILGEAEDIARQEELRVGNYGKDSTTSAVAAEVGGRYRKTYYLVYNFLDLAIKAENSVILQVDYLFKKWQIY